jgi:oxygen-independent coproporphyrinogen III oxidase
MPSWEQKYEEILKKADLRVEELRRLQSLGLICHDGEFVPSVHYPPITKYPEMTEEKLFETYKMPKDELLDIYVHLPFCERRCTFCHYPGMLGDQIEEKNRYLDALEKEMDIYLKRLGISKIKARSILIGGGTPTFLSTEQLTRFLEFFTKRVDLSHCTQFNYDVDPGTLVGEEGLERLRIMKSYGVDRLTIGVQSLNDKILKIMNRPHNAKTAVESIHNSKELGFIVNIEFIFGHPGQTMQNWIEVMEQAVSLPVDEIQMYRLKVLAYGDLQGHILKVRESDANAVPDFEETMKMKQVAIEILREHGFNENLRRVYSKEKSIFSHYAYNQCVRLYDQVGFGVTAFSSFRDRFALNTQFFDEYYKAISEGRLPLNRGYIRDEEAQTRWAIILPLKNRAVRKGYFNKVTGRSIDHVFRKKIERLKQYGLLEETPDSLTLTDLGSFVADEVVEQFNANEFMPFESDAFMDGPLHPYLDNILDERPNEAQTPPTVPNVQLKTMLSDINNLSDGDLKSLLTARGDLQQELFSKAREIRKEHMGDSLLLRGVIEISNICQKNCDYCAMRCENKDLERFRLDTDTILKVAQTILDSGIKTVFIQAGQDPKCDALLDHVIPIIANDMGAEVLLCIGERDKNTYQRFRDLGAKSFIIKFETSDPFEYERIVHTPLKNRLQYMDWIREVGMQVGTGNIMGLPNQTMDHLISDLRLVFSFKPDFVSTAPFIPNKGTPMDGHPSGDLDMALNFMAITRIGLKRCLIPSVSALEYKRSGGQLLGLSAGANVMTINFTPKVYRENYKIYNKDRFIVSLLHAQNTAKEAGLIIDANFKV